MSRIGRAPITVPAGVEVKVDENNHITVKGPKGTLERDLVPQMKVEIDAGVLHVKRPDDTKENRSLHGLTRTLIDNMVVGVTHGFEKKLEINGVGYRAAKEGKNLVMNLGYSHQIVVPETDDIQIDVPDANHVTIKGIDKQKVPSRESTSRRSASLQQKFVERDLPSRTRARASSMTTKLSAAKKARPARSKERCA